ncbi:MAG: hypothetical protein HN736_07135 [Anaerolineae bacterium]|jgi:hemerythrin-like domain-containing protein|nr:hypothetical protein [Anaerolineae bacterium]MBT3712885.1 hypothetical protein [Anaerolineae bacterium]MBT4309789.1 hypothetical protein [Anaerolineae bacterium]MBT4459924.1 hypothetical protein [Anaerolineae bacterium]MBT6060047.1 hypothetical protein [Anaerolineae bacterium]
MRIARKLNADLEIIKRFIDLLGSGMVELSGNQYARPEFFIRAHTFINEYIEGGFFKKEEMLIKTLEELGFPSDDGAIKYLRAEKKKSHEAAEQLLGATKEWQEGDEKARVDVSWAASEYTSTLRQHLDRLKNLVFPLLEQNLSIEDEHEIAMGFNAILFDGEPDKFDKLLERLEEELFDWR